MPPLDPKMDKWLIVANDCSTMPRTFFFNILDKFSLNTPNLNKVVMGDLFYPMMKHNNPDGSTLFKDDSAPMCSPWEGGVSLNGLMSVNIM